MNTEDLLHQTATTFGLTKAILWLWEKLKPQEKQELLSHFQTTVIGDESIAIGVGAMVNGRGSIAIGATDARGNVVLTGPLHTQTPGGTTVHIG